MNRILLALLVAPIVAASPAPVPADDGFVALCYHDVVARGTSDAFAVEESAFIQQLEYLIAREAHFLTVDELLAARDGKKALPPRSVLLTFDDGCKSFVTRVLPVLRLYKVPAVLSVVTGWTEQFPGAGCEDGVMSWDEIRQVAKDPLVEIGSHSHDLHRPLMLNRGGGTGPAATTRVYDPGTDRYETEAEYRARLARDLQLSHRVLTKELGHPPRLLTWPYGAYTPAAVEEGKAAGFEVMLTLHDDQDGGVAKVSKLDRVVRRMLMDHPDVEQFARGYWSGGPQTPWKPVPHGERAVHADLDLLYDPDPEATRRNVDRFVERMVTLKPNVVYLQAFVDDSGSGNVSQLYFPNRVLPMKADLFAFVARALQIREIAVYAWMPTLSYVLPDPKETESLRVRERFDGGTRPSKTNYRRLSPFSPKARARVATIFEDLAAAVAVEGILFQDDAYLDEEEDYHPSALPVLEALGIDPAKGPTAAQVPAWTARKTEALIEWTDAMVAAARRHQPRIRGVRTLYAPVLSDPESQRWFAMSYEASLRAEGNIVVLAYPLMEKVKDAGPWLRGLVEVAKKAGGLDRTNFKVQTVDWARGNTCVPTPVLRGWLDTLLTAGARHLSYYPDNLYEDCPRAGSVRAYIGTEAFPLQR